MGEVYEAIDWIFTNIQTIFGFMLTSWILSTVIFIGLISCVIQLYRSIRSR